MMYFNNRQNVTLFFIIVREPGRAGNMDNYMLFLHSLQVLWYSMIRMNASDKEKLYTLLKVTSDACCGYASPEFSTEQPVFTDDLPAPGAAAVPKTDGSTLEMIAAQIAACSRCQLARTRTNVVPGMGVSRPSVLVVGEGPGYEEDMQGIPFVGPAGKLLDKMLAAVSLDRRVNCYIANIVKCRPPQNRTPLAEEADACSSFLEAQINLLQPHMILAAGRTAGQNLLKTDMSLTRLRGRFYDYNGIPLLVTYHPSALLRDASLKRPAWDDLKIFRARLLEIDPHYADGSTSGVQ